MTTTRHAATSAALAVAVAVVGTAAACDGAGGDCSEDRCVSASSREEVLAALEAHRDPVAEYLRGAVTGRGTLTGDYRTVLEGVGDITGCSADTERTFVVLSNVEYTPRPVHARCASDPVEASRFLMVMAGVTETPDIDPQVIHMVGWDPDAQEYRRYATFPDDRGEMALNVSPEFCFGCHGGPQKLDTWQPLMNVMTNPWSGWNAEPGFASHLFDENLAEQYRRATVFDTMFEHADSASNLEPIVRAGLDRVTAARLDRRDTTDVDEALTLLRPLFCDETVNLVSEVHDSGEIRASAVIDDALRALFARLPSNQSSWSWLGSPSLQFSPPTPDDAPLDLFPVRGESTIQVELGLAARGVLSAQEILRVRAVDWKRPAASEARCGLYQRGRDKILPRRAELAGAAPGQLVPQLFAEIMSEIPVPDGADVVAIADGDRFDEREPMTIEQFGAAIEAHVESIRDTGRAALRDRRRQAACKAAALYPFFPLAADLRCD